MSPHLPTELWYMILFPNDTLDNKLYFRKDIVEIDIIYREHLEFKTMRLYVDIKGRTIYKRLKVSCLLYLI
jgi:hypothetical protein